MRSRSLAISAVAAAALALSVLGSTVGSAADGKLAPFDKSHAGGTVKLVAQAAAGTLDPKVNYTGQYWELYQATYDGLLTFSYGTGKTTFNVVPDLAEALPTITNGGKTLTFKLRKGIKFSDGTDVTVKDVKASFERIFKVSSPTAGSFYNGLSLIHISEPTRPY